VATVGQVGQERLYLVDAILVVLRGEVADAALRGVGHGAAQIVMGDFLADNRLDDVGAGDVHVGALLHHEHPVGEGRGIDGAARRGSHDGGDLGDVSRADGVAVEDAAVAVQGRDAFLDPGAAGIVQGHEGFPRIQGHIHDLPDLLGVHLAEAPPGAGEVLGRRIDGPAVDLAETDNDAVGVYRFFV